MTFSALAGDRRLALGFYHSGGRKLRRYMARNGGRITAITNHGIVGDIAALQRELLKTSRTLSVNYGVGSDGKVYGCVSERFKANTTSHVSDHYSVTLEIANDPRYPHVMTDAAFDAAARLNADICVRHGIVPSERTINFHREYVATQCPGDHTWARRHEFIALVQKYVAQLKAGASPAPAPAPAPAKPAPAKPSSPAPKGAELLKGVGVGDTVRLSRWYLYDSPTLDPNVGKRLVSGDYKIIGISYKYRPNGEPSLRVQDARGGTAWTHYSAVDGVIGKGATPAPAPAPKPPAKPAGKSIAQMATEVIAGKHGTGHANRQRSLGVNAATYAKVRAEVNRRV